ncbi:transmembrane protein 131-like isoform X2 [Mizuhopecten yessoensis]|uniref:Transmembrane protein 131 n=1 Tax=Mizuhopecten yessoensis TaxID=6573 RepID=A0A210PLB6_MIZYE|nr:transmembrane protein 131-like isoform X2 [Mizuhopecten yessoensis]OWF37267.1 Transmembrane protein 131 [Mizuhopecten yessoensis]
MARVACHREKMSVEWFHFILLFHSIQNYFPHTTAVESHNQAFIQTDNHLTYIGGTRDLNGIPLNVKPGHLHEHDSPEDILFKSSSIRLDPPWLDFQEQSVGMPQMEQVVIQNTDPKHSLHLLSISGSTVHFHCSFFQDKTVPPGGNTTFDVVFLARQEGNAENTLYIHTSQGPVTYHVFGVGIPNPYRLRPYLGAKVPLNSSFSPVIQMHNPHSSMLQVLEMFSSEGDLHLELPTGELEAPKNLWEIPPYETKAVMKANFIGRVENNHTAFIRIKTNQEQNSRLLILPVEVEVSSVPGIYSPLELIDFGILRTLDEPTTIQLSLVNTGPKPLHVTGITVSPPNNAISIEFRPIRLQPDIIRHTPVAQITFKAARALHPKQWSGKIIVKTKNSQVKTVLPYQATVLHGSLVYNSNSSQFFSPKNLMNITRVMMFTNTFNFSIVIYNVTLPSDIAHFFSILNFTEPVTLQPQHTLVPFLLQFHPNETQLHFNSHLTLHTNASTFTVPIVVYNGELKVIPHRPERFKGQLDFGTMGIQETRSMVFTLRNDNPVDVHIGEITPDLNGTVVQFLGMEKGNGTTLTRIHNTTDVDYNFLKIKPYHFAVFSLNLTAPDYEGDFSTEMLITTQFQDIWIPVSVRTAAGSLHFIPESLVFDKAYPGNIPYRVMQIYSTFREYMTVTGVSFQPSDPRFYYKPTNTDRIVLEPLHNTVVGRVYFDAKKECGDDCYVGLPLNTPPGHQWLLGLTLEKEVADTDQYFFTRLQQKWHKIQQAGLHTANVTIELDTSEVRGFLYSAQAHMEWPSLVKMCKIRFPLTQIGNSSTADFIVENPGTSPVLIQMIPLALYPNAQTLLDMMNWRISSEITDYVETEDVDIFTLPDLERYHTNPKNVVPKFRKNVEEKFGVKPHPESITAVLGPDVKIKVRVGFHPKDDISRTSLILIRNNLTILDALVIQGQGGRGEMKLSNKKPGSGIPLQFDMTEKHLKNCDKKKHTKSMAPNFTVRRSFTLKNTGELPFYVHGYSINGASCEGYGFRVLDCDGFHMLPNTSRKIDIAFTPDFTMSRIRRTLTVYTSLGAPANYTLQATVPPHTLSKCSSALPRPNWEPVLYYSIVCAMGFLLCCILVAAYFEADRIFVSDIIRRKIKISNSTQTFDKSKVFDLKQVAGINSCAPVKLSQLSDGRSSPSTKPMLELANGHVEHNSKTPPFYSTLLSIAKNFFSPKPSRAPARPKVEPQDCAESTQSLCNSYKPGQEKEKSSLKPESIISEKSIPAQKTKKSKAARRQHDLHLNTENHCLPSRGGNKEAPNQDNNKKLPESVRMSLLDKQDRYGKSRSSSTTDTLDEITLPDDLVSISQPTIDGKNKGKKRMKRSERDAIPVNRYVRNISDDKDETSSTTTESSVGDGDEKSSSARDSTPEPPPSKPRKTKSKARTVKMIGHYDDTYDDDEFELTSKSKAHKRIKVSSKDAYGGNILMPDTYDLPYNLENKADKLKNGSSSSDSNRKPGKSKAQAKGLLLSSWPGLDSSEESDSTPNWDTPSPGPRPEDLSELSIQTENFAQKQKTPTTNGFSFSPDGLTSSSRSSSYSSIVSNNSSEGNGQTKPKANEKRFPPGFVPFCGDIVLPAIGTKAKSAPVGAGKSRSNVWKNSPPSTPDAVNNSFGLQTIQENRLTSGLPESGSDPFAQQDTPFGNTVFPDTPLYNYSPTGTTSGGISPTTPTTPTSIASSTTAPGFDQPQTMMQKLMADRRRRVKEHQIRFMKGQEWPGFDYPAVRSESLWDSEYQSMDNRNQWSTTTDSPPTSSSGGLWSTLTNSANSGWNSLMSFTSGWGGNTPVSTSTDTMTTESFSGNDANHSPTPNGSPENVGTFNPFNSMADIWGPNAPNTSSGWNYPPPTGDNMNFPPPNMEVRSMPLPAGEARSYSAPAGDSSDRHQMQ